MAHHAGAGDGRVDVVGVVGGTTVASSVRGSASVGTRLLLRLRGIVDMTEELFAKSYRS